MSRNPNQIQSLSLAEVIAYRNPTVANKFLIHAGYGPSRDSKEMSYKLAKYIADNGEDCLPGLAEIHPDRDWIVPPQVKQNQPATQNQNMNIDGFDNCRGNGCSCKKYHNAAGDTAEAGNQLRSSNLFNNQTMMLGIIALTAITVIALTRGK